MRAGSFRNGALASSQGVRDMYHATMRDYRRQLAHAERVGAEFRRRMIAAGIEIIHDEIITYTQEQSDVVSEIWRQVNAEQCGGVVDMEV